MLIESARWLPLVYGMTWTGGVHDGDEQLYIMHIDADGQLFTHADSKHIQQTIHQHSQTSHTKQTDT